MYATFYTVAFYKTMKKFLSLRYLLSFLTLHNFKNLSLCFDRNFDTLFLFSSNFIIPIFFHHPEVVYFNSKPGFRLIIINDKLKQIRMEGKKDGIFSAIFFSPIFLSILRKWRNGGKVGAIQLKRAALKSRENRVEKPAASRARSFVGGEEGDFN